MDIEQRVTRLECQYERLVSDTESEKGTRARVNTDHEIRLRAIEMRIYMATGALAILQILLAVYLKH